MCRNCGKKYCGGCKGNDKECMADHTPNREAYGMFVAKPGVTGSAMSVVYANKNIVCMTQGTDNFLYTPITIQFKKNTFACKSDGEFVFNGNMSSNTPILISQNTIKGGTMTYSITLNGYKSNEMKLNMTPPISTHFELPLHFVQPKTICEVITMDDLFNKNDEDGNQVYKLRKFDTLDGSSTHYVKAKCPEC